MSCRLQLLKTRLPIFSIRDCRAWTTSAKFANIRSSSWYLAVSSRGQDTWFSATGPGFESPYRYQRLPVDRHRLRDPSSAASLPPAEACTGRVWAERHPLLTHHGADGCGCWALGFLSLPATRFRVGREDIFHPCRNAGVPRVIAASGPLPVPPRRHRHALHDADPPR